MASLSRWWTLAAALLLAGTVAAQNKTLVRDTLYNADGTRASGQVEISWASFTSPDGKTIAGGRIVKRVTDGVLEVSLVPNQNATPAGTSYAVGYLLTSGASYQETWVVPQGGPVTVGAVRASVAPSPSVLINQSQLILGSGLKSLLGLVRQTPATRPVATAPGQCYFDTESNQLLCSNNELNYVAPPSGPPTGAAAGDLSGNFPNPTVRTATTDSFAVGASNKATLSTSGLTTDRTFSLPDSSGTLALAADPGIKSLNSLSMSTQWINTGQSGNDFNITTSGNTHVLNLPNASPTARGLVSTGAQTFGGPKSFSQVAVNQPSPNATLDVGPAASGFTFYAGAPYSANSALIQSYLNLTHNVFAEMNPGVPFGAALVGTTRSAAATNMFGLYGVVEHALPAGSVPVSVGVEGDAYHSGAGTIDTLAGVAGYGEVAGPGTVNHLAGMWLQSNAKTAGTVTNNYGIKVEDQAIAGANNYAIKTGAGKVEFGDKLTAKGLNNIRFADQFPGADAGAKIAAAIADLPAGGGTVDARGLEGAQSITSGVTVDKPITLLLGAVTLAVSANEAFTITSSGVSIAGAGRDHTRINFTGTGKLFNFAGSGGRLVGITVKELTLDGGAPAAQTAIHLALTEQAVVSGVRILNFCGAVRSTGDGVSDVSILSILRDSLITGYSGANCYGASVDHTVDFQIVNTQFWSANDAATGHGIIADRGLDTLRLVNVNVEGSQNSLLVRNTNQGGAYGIPPTNGFISNSIFDGSHGGDAVLFDSTLGTEVVGYHFSDSWAAAAGLSNAGTCTTPGAVGLKIAGGATITWQGGRIRANCLHGVHVTSSGQNYHVEGATIHSNNRSDNPAGHGVRIEATATEVYLRGNRVSNAAGLGDSGLGKQRYGVSLGPPALYYLLANDLAGNQAGRVEGGAEISVEQGTVTATTFSGALSGNASTATALAADPAACPANQWVTDFTAAGVLACAQPAFSNLSGAATLAQLPFGAANQVLGTNAGATAQEHKTLSVGTTGTDFAIAHAANSIAFNLPDASATARGAVTTGDQTFAGSKTFSSAASFSSVSPTVHWYESDGAVDGKQWRTIVDGGIFYLQTVNDAYSTAVAAIQIERSGNSISAVSFPNSRVVFNPGTTAAQAIALEMAQPAAAGQRDSHFLDLRGTSFDTAGHNADWRAFADVTSNAGASAWTLQSRIDTASFANRMTVTNAGMVTATTFSGALSGNASTATALAADPADCSGNNFALGINAAGTAACAQPAFSNLSGAATLAQLPFGTANQVLGTNAGATAQEHKTLSVGTTGTDFAIAHAANSIAFNLPDASATARGALASADWTTFNSKVGASRAISTTAPLTGGGDLSADRTLSITADGIGPTQIDETAAYTWSGTHVFSGATVRVPNATTLPGTCTIGDLYMDNDETPAGQQVYICSATNTWSKIGDGGSGGGLGDPGANGIVVRTALNTTTSRSIAATANETAVTNGDGVSGNPTIALAATVDMSAKAATLPVKAGTTAGAPATCTANKELYIKTDATAGQQLFICNGTGNGWNLVGDGGGGGGDSITVNATAATDANLNDSLPAAAGSGVNVKWQIDAAASPDNVSAYVQEASGTQGGIVTTGTQTLAGAKTFSSVISGTAGATLSKEPSAAQDWNLYAGTARASLNATSQGLVDNASSAVAHQRADSTKQYGLLGLLESSGTAGQATGLMGASVSTHASGTRTYGIGVEGDAYNKAAGAVTNLFGVYAYAQQDGAGAITEMASLYAESNWKSVGTVTRNYGLWVADQNIAGASNYAIKTGLGQVQFGDKTTIDPGTTPTTALLLDMAQPVVAGQRDSHFLDMRGTAFDTSGHNANWRTFADVTSNAGASSYTWQSRIDAGGFGTRMSLTDAGALTISGGDLSVDTGDITWASGQGASLGILNHINSATRTYTFPDATGTVALLATAGTNGIAAYNAGDDTAAARSDHTHRTIHAVTWFFPGTPGTGVQNMTLALPEGITNPAITDMRVTVNTTSAGSSTFNIQRCTAGCTGTTPTFADIYSTNLTLNASTRTVAKAAAPDQNVSGLAAGDQFKANLVTIGASLADVTVTMTYKAEVTN